MTETATNPMATTDALVTIDNVSVVFGEEAQTALPWIDQGTSQKEIKDQTGQILGVANASLEVKQGEILVLMGLSGSGKSTLLRAINGLNPITRGSVRIKTDKGVVDVANCSKSSLRDLRSKSVAMVFQQFGLLPWRTVQDNVGFGLELAGIKAGERKARIKDQLELVGLSEWADKSVAELSGGMQQRVGLARAFATGAPILLMDEPYSALDPLIRAHLQDELLALQEKLKCTIIFVSHDLDEAIKLGNRIAIMQEGRIIQVGTPQDIIIHPADDYVADFVAHMNPLQVLRAQEVMRPLRDTSVQREENTIIWRERRHPLVILSEDDVLGDIAKEQAGDVVFALPERTQMKQILALRLESDWPILVHKDGELVGLIAEHDIYKALVR